MATFGRRPAKNSKSADEGRRSAPLVSIGRGSGGGSDAFRSMMQEEEERERLEREHEERERHGHRTKDSTDDSSHRAQKHKGPNPRVFFQIEVRGKLNAKLLASGRLEFELFADTAPKTSENFRCLATGEKGRELSFANCMFHSIVPGLMAQGGAISVGGGQGRPPEGRSIYGDTFADEDFSRRHDARGMLSMANTGPDTNNSQFQLMFEKAAHLDKKHVVFGKMTRDEGGILDSIEQAGSKSGVPKSMVSIVKSGEIGGMTADTRSRSRSRSLPHRVQFRSGGRVDHKAQRNNSGQSRKGAR